MRDADPQATPVVRFVGRLSEIGRAEIESAGVSDLVEETGFLPHDEAIGQLASSSVLIGADVAGSDPVALGRVPGQAVRVPRKRRSDPLPSQPRQRRRVDAPGPTRLSRGLRGERGRRSPGLSAPRSRIPVTGERWSGSVAVPVPQRSPPLSMTR